MPQFQGGFYRRYFTDRDVIEYWFDDRDYEDGLSADGRVFSSHGLKAAEAEARKKIVQGQHGY